MLLLSCLVVPPQLAGLQTTGDNKQNAIRIADLEQQLLVALRTCFYLKKNLQTLTSEKWAETGAGENSGGGEREASRTCKGEER